MSDISKGRLDTESIDFNPKKPCRTCTDFKTWMKNKKADSAKKNPSENSKGRPPGHDCPLDKDELGRNTWGFLHTMAANYPDKPTESEKNNMKTFMESFSKVYPCEVCAYDFRKRMAKKPVETDSQSDLSQWLCGIHNQINKMLGKPTFDCSKVNERWRDGWSDGSCD